MTKRKEREQDKNAGRKRKGSGRTRERKGERKREQDRQIERRGEVQGSKENHSSVGKRGGQGRDRDTEEGRQGPKGPELTTALALGAARRICQFRHFFLLLSSLPLL